MGVQERSKYLQICIIIYKGRHFSFDFSIASDTRNSHALSFVEVDSELSFYIFHKFLITESQKGVLSDTWMVETAVHPHKAVIDYTLLYY